MLSTGCDAVFDALKIANRKERVLRRELGTSSIGVERRTAIKVIIALAFVVLLVLAFVSQQGFHTASSAIEWGVIVCITVIYGGVFYYAFAEIWPHRDKLRLALKEPFRIVLNNARLTTQADEVALDTLMRLNLDVLEMAAMQIEHEHHAFQRRIGLVIGSLEKLGLFPAFLAYLVGILKIGNMDNQWVDVIVYSLPLLYFAGFYGQHLLMQLERNARLLELVIARKKALASKPKPWKLARQGAHS